MFKSKNTPNPKRLLATRVKPLSWALLLIFVVQDFAWALPNPTQSTQYNKTININTPKVPSSVATIDEIYIARHEARGAGHEISPSKTWLNEFAGTVSRPAPRAPRLDKTIILIQDAHMNASAQLNIARSIESILSQTQVKTVYLEGGEGNSSLEFLKPHGTPALRHQSALAYLHKGYMGGAEYLSMTSKKEFGLWGVENKALYQEAIKVYVEVIGQRSNTLKTLSKLEAATAYLLPHYLKPSLLSLIQVKQKRNQGEIPLGTYSDYLRTLAQEYHLDLNARENMKQFSHIIEIESHIDFEQANREMSELGSAIDISEQEDLKQWMQSLSANNQSIMPAAHINALRLMLDKQGDSNLALHAYLEYMQFMHTLDLNALTQEIENLENELIQAMVSDANESKMIEALEAIDFYKSLIHMQITSKHIHAYKRNPGQYEIEKLMAFVNKKILDQGQYLSKALWMDVEFAAAIQKALEFYELTLKRDQSILNELLNRMDMNQETASILLIGGYHAQNIKQQLEERGVNYISILPNVTHETNHSYYEKVLMGQYQHDAMSTTRFEALWRQSQSLMPQSSISREPLASNNVSPHIKRDFYYLAAQFGPQALAQARQVSQSRMAPWDGEYEFGDPEEDASELPDGFERIDESTSWQAFNTILDAIFNLPADSDLYSRIRIPNEGSDKGIVMYTFDNMLEREERLIYIDASTAKRPMVRINHTFMKGINPITGELLILFDGDDYSLNLGGVFKKVRRGVWDEAAVTGLLDGIDAEADVDLYLPYGFEEIDQDNMHDVIEIMRAGQVRLPDDSPLKYRLIVTPENLINQLVSLLMTSRDEEPINILTINNMDSSMPIWDANKEYLIGVDVGAREVIIYFDGAEHILGENGSLRPRMAEGFVRVDESNGEVVFSIFEQAQSNLAEDSVLSGSLEVDGEDHVVSLKDPDFDVPQAILEITRIGDYRIVVTADDEILMGVNMDSRAVLLNLSGQIYVLRSDGQLTPRMAEGFRNIDTFELKRQAWEILDSAIGAMGANSEFGGRFRLGAVSSNTFQAEYFKDPYADRQMDRWQLILDDGYVNKRILKGINPDTNELLLHVDVLNEASDIKQDHILNAHGDIWLAFTNDNLAIDKARRPIRVMHRIIDDINHYIQSDSPVRDVLNPVIKRIAEIIGGLTEGLNKFEHSIPSHNDIEAYINQVDTMRSKAFESIDRIRQVDSAPAGEITALTDEHSGYAVHLHRELIYLKEALQDLLERTAWTEPIVIGDHAHQYKQFPPGFEPIQPEDYGAGIAIFLTVLENLDYGAVLHERLEFSEDGSMVLIKVDEMLPDLWVNIIEVQNGEAVIKTHYLRAINFDTRELIIHLDGHDQILSQDGQLRPSRMTDGFLDIEGEELHLLAFDILKSAKKNLPQLSEFGLRFQVIDEGKDRYTIGFKNNPLSMNSSERKFKIILGRLRSRVILDKSMLKKINPETRELLFFYEGRDWILDDLGDLRAKDLLESPIVQRIRQSIGLMHNTLAHITTALEPHSPILTLTTPLFRNIKEMTIALLSEATTMIKMPNGEQIMVAYRDTFADLSIRTREFKSQIDIAHGASAEEIQILIVNPGYAITLHQAIVDLEQYLEELVRDAVLDEVEPTFITDTQYSEGFVTITVKDYFEVVRILQLVLNNTTYGTDLYERIQSSSDGKAIALVPDLDMAPDDWEEIIKINTDVPGVTGIAINLKRLLAINHTTHELLLNIDGHDQILSQNGQLRPSRMTDGFEEIKDLVLHWQAYHIFSSILESETGGEYDEFRGRFDVKYGDRLNFLVRYYGRPSLGADEEWQVLIRLKNGVPYVNERLLKGINSATNELLLNIPVIGREKESAQDQILNIKGEHRVYRPSEKMRIDNINAYIEKAKQLKMLIDSVIESDAEIRDIVGDGLGRIRLFVEGLTVSLREFDHKETTKATLGRYINQFTDKAQVALGWIEQIQELSDPKPDEVDVLTHDASGYIVQLHALLEAISKELDALYQTVAWEKSASLTEVSNAWPVGFVEVNPTLHGLITMNILRSISKKTEVVTDLNERLRTELSGSLILFKADKSAVGREGWVSIAAEIGRHVDIEQKIIRAINSQTKELILFIDQELKILNAQGELRSVSRMTDRSEEWRAEFAGISLRMGGLAGKAIVSVHPESPLKPKVDSFLGFGYGMLGQIEDVMQLSLTEDIEAELLQIYINGLERALKIHSIMLTTINVMKDVSKRELQSLYAEPNGHLVLYAAELRNLKKLLESAIEDSMPEYRSGEELFKSAARVREILEMIKEQWSLEEAQAVGFGDILPALAESVEAIEFSEPSLVRRGMDAELRDKYLSSLNETKEAIDKIAENPELLQHLSDQALRFLFTVEDSSFSLLYRELSRLQKNINNYSLSENEFITIEARRVLDVIGRLDFLLKRAEKRFRENEPLMNKLNVFFEAVLDVMLVIEMGLESAIKLESNSAALADESMRLADLIQSMKQLPNIIAQIPDVTQTEQYRLTNGANGHFILIEGELESLKRNLEAYLDSNRGSARLASIPITSLAQVVKEFPSHIGHDTMMIDFADNTDSIKGIEPMSIRFSGEGDIFYAQIQGATQRIELDATLFSTSLRDKGQIETSLSEAQSVLKMAANNKPQVDLQNPDAAAVLTVHLEDFESFDLETRRQLLIKHFLELNEHLNQNTRIKLEGFDVLMLDQAQTIIEELGLDNLLLSEFDQLNGYDLNQTVQVHIITQSVLREKIAKGQLPEVSELNRYVVLSDLKADQSLNIYEYESLAAYADTLARIDLDTQNTETQKFLKFYAKNSEGDETNDKVLLNSLYTPQLAVRRVLPPTLKLRLDHALQLIANSIRTTLRAA